ncbi:type II toxin-antitoxin system toxin DNA ADP-ribosyl transferase DarT [Ectopseudomonas hydrolytica]|uniref:type II toxin-antitoxin system toxin DNA ADP-ribosyl transferase DarT n=1 Tax=Ectopseudomonas hydrolytica TaxID=2493633 RepID=UPI003EE1A86B
MAVPAQPKIYHICHVDRLPSIIASAGLLSDAVLLNQALPGTVIGMNHIKQRRLQLELDSHPGLHVGECVPFYFCPRSVMLFLISRGHQDLAYNGGQGPIVHLQADLHATVQWANAQARRWAFTLSNAGSNYFEDRADLAQLNEIDWDAVAARIWHQCKEPKQAEFLLEQSFPWHLVERIGVQSRQIYTQVANALPAQGHRPTVELRPEWYY